MNHINYFSEKEIDLLTKAKKNKEYLHLKNNSNKDRSIIKLKEVNNLISMHNAWNIKNFKLLLDRKPINFSQFCTEGAEMGFTSILPDPIKVQDFIKKGASLVLDDIIYLSNEIKTFAKDLQRITLGKCEANLYLSMKSHQAFGPHFDTHDVFALHCDGEKVWNIYEALEDNPINHPIFKSNVEERAKKAGKIIEKVVMKPGDLLYIPRGKFHDALASKSGAIHIAFGINYMKPIDIIQLIWNELITNSYLRSDIRSVNGTDDIEKINKKIISELKIIFENKSFFDPILQEYNNWPYNLIDYDLENIVKGGVHYAVSKSVSLSYKEGNMFLIDSKNTVKVPKNFEKMTKFSFEQQNISIEILKNNFPNNSDNDISEFVDAMKNMSVFY